LSEALLMTCRMHDGLILSREAVSNEFNL
jgi:hypothetical protein